MKQNNDAENNKKVSVLTYFFGVVLALIVPCVSSTDNFLAPNSLVFKTLSTQPGFLLNNVTAIMQDSRGFLWIGTENGLKRYDGYELKMYNNIPSDQASLSHNEIASILEDRDGFIWLGTEGGGLNKFDPKSERFVHFFNDQIKEVNWDALSDDEVIPLDAALINIADSGLANDNISHNVIHALAQDDEGNLWIGTEGGGLNVLNQTTGKFHHYLAGDDDSHSLCDNEIKTLFIDSQNLIWAGTENGLSSYQPANQTFTCYRYQEDDVNSLSHNEISSILEDKHGNLWIGTEEAGLNYFERDKNRFSHFQYDSSVSDSVSSNSIEDLLFDQESRLWVATENGLNLFNSEQQNFSRFHHQPNNKTGLSSNRLSALLLDSSHNLWVATKNAGLNHVDLKPKKFHKSSLNRAGEAQWYSHPVNAIYQDSLDSLWIGTENEGLFEYQNNGTTRHYHASDINSGLNINVITAISEDTKANLFLATDDGGFYKLDRQHQTFERIALNATKNSIATLHIGHSQYIWMSAGVGTIARISPSLDDIQYHPLLMNDGNEVVAADISSILELDDGMLWLGTKESGLIVYNPSSKQTIVLKNNPEQANSLSSNIVNTVKSDHKGGLWIGTHFGLNHYNPDSGQFTLYTEEHGLPSNVVNNIVIDQNNQLWLSTQRGLTRFNPARMEFSNFGLDDGLSNAYFQTGSAHINKNGELFFGGSKGIDHVKPETVITNPFPPKVQFTDFQVMNQSVKPSQRGLLAFSITETNVINLNHQQTMFAFEFSALDFTIANKNQYAYRLLGFDQTWQFVGNRRYASYTNIPAGNYRFEVKATNNDGLWSLQNAGIDINIAAAPWLTWWAKLIYALIIVSLIFLALTLRFRQERNRLAMEQKKEEALFLKESYQKEQRFTADVAHELRTPIAELRTMAEVALRWPDDPAQAQPFYQDTLDAALQMQQMVNNLLALVRADLGVVAIHLSDIDLTDMLLRVWENYKTEINSKQFSLSTDLSQESLIHSSAAEFRLILNNIISNAIEYAPSNTTIDVKLMTTQDGYYCLSISNQMIELLTEQDLLNMFNRMWRKDLARSSEQHAGLGMSLIQSYARMLSLTVDVKVNEHQIFTISIGKIPIV